MRYRIKITTFKSGRQEFAPQVRKMFLWVSINFLGETVSHENNYSTRNEALKCIDKHMDGNARVRTIEFEYITKN